MAPAIRTAPTPTATALPPPNGRLVFEMFRVSSDSYRALCDAIVAAFELVPNSSLVDGWDLIFQDYRNGDHVVGLEWDNWTGFTVIAKNSDSEPLVRDIAAWL